MTEIKSRQNTKPAFHMVDIHSKYASYRKAIAAGSIVVGETAFNLLATRALPKGDALILAEIAGIQSAKMAYQMIPLCHPLALEKVDICTELDKEKFAVNVYCVAATHAKTGVEMEALAGVNAALLTIYDLCKMIEPELTIHNVRLLYKEGGKSGIWRNSVDLPEITAPFVETESQPLLQGKRGAVISISDRAFRGTENYPDIGTILSDLLQQELGMQIDAYALVPDDQQMIAEKIKSFVAQYAPDLLFLHGGTGVSPRDRTPEAVLSVCDRVVPGIGELIRKGSEKYTPLTWLSRAIGATLNQTLILTLPGSKNAISEVIGVVKNILPRAIHELHREA